MSVAEHYSKIQRKLLGAARDPAAAWDKFRDRIDWQREYSRPPCHYDCDPDWERQLHERMGIPFPCAAAAEFRELWPRIGDFLTAKGYRFGPESYFSWNDGDGALVRAIWCLIRHQRPATIVETGVGHGVTTRCILEALERNGGAGRLYSIDPPPSDPAAAAQIGVAVDGFAAERWRLLQGTSRRRLPRLVADLGRIDLFIHDSLHTKRNVGFEIGVARPALPPGGFMVIDDIDTNWGFHALAARHPGDRFWVCESEPARPDLRRFNDKGLFGIIQRSSA
ncbi:MAG TPA: class I SAM-dependent methyltransferase [Stellaceae bacterium]|nr:class I SAM-dependent methyltransferase [Stellaceae bacterium]